MSPSGETVCVSVRFRLVSRLTEQMRAFRVRYRRLRESLVPRPSLYFRCEPSVDPPRNLIVHSLRLERLFSPPRHESVRLPRVLRRTISHRRGGLDLLGVSDCSHRSELECSNARWLGVLGQSSKNSAISASRLAERRLSRERRAVGEGDGADPQSSIGLRVLGLGLVA
jgi:hypothetical protein